MTSRSSNEFNDQDIARVFEAHDVDVPADLDDLVLRAARQNGPAKNPSNNPINNQQAYRRNNWYMHGFAIAATVMLSIAIAPLLLQSPDTTPKTTLGDSDLALSTAATLNRQC